MRQLAGGLNRGWLAVIGIVLLIVGVAGTLATTGVLGQLIAAAGVRWSGPAGGSPVVDDGAAGLLAQPVAVVALAVLGVILGVLGLAWLLAQIPRTNAAQPYRLHDDAVTGLTVCSPDVLATAVAEEHQVLRRGERSERGAARHLRGTGAHRQGQRRRPRRPP